jgi:iron complex outermembrane recepter protein
MSAWKHARRVLLASAALSSVSWQAAVAQDTPEASPDGAVSDESVKELDVIVVTANRREESLQDVPVSVQAISTDEVLARSVNDLQELPALAPGLTFTRGNSPGSSGFNMRGVGTSAFAASGEQSVGLIVDGVPIGSAGAGLSSIVDIEHVEILKGPQGTLFGRNASAGLVSVTSAAPDASEFGGRLRASYGSLNEQIYEGMFNIPLGDSTAFRIAANTITRDGNYDNLKTGNDINGEDAQFVRARLRSDITDIVRLDLFAEYAVRDAACCQGGYERAAANVLPLLSPPFVSRRPAIGRFSTELASRNDPFVDSTNEALGVELNVDMNFATLTSLTSYRNYENNYGGDLDQTPFTVGVFGDITDDQKQTTQEFRLASNGESDVNWQIGAMIYRAELDRDTIVSGALNLTTLNAVEWQSNAVFGQLTWNAADKLALTAGGRFTDDKVQENDFAFVPVRVPTGSGAITADDFSYRLSAEYNWTPDVMTYVTASTGYKGPATVGDAGGNVVQPETSTNYELGLRSQFLDGRFTLNATLFSMNFEDLQVSTVDAVTLTPRLRNGGELKTEGLELETRFLVTDNLTLTANGAYTDAKYENFTGVPCTPHLRALTTQCTIVSPTVAFYNASGFQAVQAPETAFTLGLDHLAQLTDNFSFRSQLNYEWKDDHFLAIADPFSVQDSYGVLDLTFSLRPASEAWELSVFGRNVGDEVYTSQFGSALANQGGTFRRIVPYQAETRYGVSIAANF